MGAGKGAEGDLLAKLVPEIASTAVQGVEFKELTRILLHGGPSTSLALSRCGQFGNHGNSKILLHTLLLNIVQTRRVTP